MWGYMLRHRRDVVLSFGAAVLGSACQAIVPLIERQIVDAVIVAHSTPLWPWLVFLIALAASFFLPSPHAEVEKQAAIYGREEALNEPKSETVD